MTQPTGIPYGLVPCAHVGNTTSKDPCEPILCGERTNNTTKLYSLYAQSSLLLLSEVDDHLQKASKTSSMSRSPDEKHSFDHVACLSLHAAALTTAMATYQHAGKETCSQMLLESPQEKRREILTGGKWIKVLRRRIEPHYSNVAMVHQTPE